MIALHIREELSYEKSIDYYENIYRVHREGWAKSSPVLAGEMKEFMPEVEAIGRLSSYRTRVVNTDNNHGEVTGYYADSTLLKVFNFKVTEADAQPLVAPNTVVITQSMARRYRYFTNQNAIGKIVKFDQVFGSCFTSWFHC